MQASQSLSELPKRIIIGLMLWFAAELCAFALVVCVLGIAGALLLGLVTSLLGLSLLRRLGRDAAGSLRQVLSSQTLVLKSESMVDGTISAVAGVLLVLPGFLSDLVGFALSAPTIRVWLAKRMNGGHRPVWSSKTEARRSEQVIELGAQEWRRLDETAPDWRGRG